MTENNELTNQIVEGIQDKKGKNIVVVELSKLPEAPCEAFVICEGDSNVHVNAIAFAIKDRVREKLRVKPMATDGFENCQWIAMDYGQTIVHVFQRPYREFYDLEHLWMDADLRIIPPLD